MERWLNMSIGENFGREMKFYIRKIDKKRKISYNKKEQRKESKYEV